MAAAWPATLPKAALRSNYSMQYGDGRVLTDMEQGPPRARRLYNNVPNQFTVQFSLSSEQLDAFETLWNTTLNGGSSPVNIPVRTSAGAPMVPVLILKRSNLAFDEADKFLLTLTVITV